MKTIRAEEFDRLFDEGSDEVDQYVDWSSLTRPGESRQFVSVRLSDDLIESIDRVVDSEGTDRQAVIEGWIAEGAQAASA